MLAMPPGSLYRWRSPGVSRGSVIAGFFQSRRSGRSISPSLIDMMSTRDFRPIITSRTSGRLSSM